VNSEQNWGRGDQVISGEVRRLLLSGEALDRRASEKLLEKKQGRRDKDHGWRGVPTSASRMASMRSWGARQGPCEEKEAPLGRTGNQRREEGQGEGKTLRRDGMPVEAQGLEKGTKLKIYRIRSMKPRGHLSLPKDSSKGGTTLQKAD